MYRHKVVPDWHLVTQCPTTSPGHLGTSVPCFPPSWPSAFHYRKHFVFSLCLYCFLFGDHKNYSRESLLWSQESVMLLGSGDQFPSLQWCLERFKESQKPNLQRVIYSGARVTPWSVPRDEPQSKDPESLLKYCFYRALSQRDSMCHGRSILFVTYYLGKQHNSVKRKRYLANKETIIKT